MDQLSELNACRPASAEAVPAAWSHIETPVNMEKAGLAKFSDQVFARNILTGLEQGFRIGFRRDVVLRQVG